MKQTFTVIIQSNIIGGDKLAIRVNENKMYQLRQLLAPELKSMAKKSNAAQLHLKTFLTEKTNDQIQITQIVEIKIAIQGTLISF